MIDVQRGQFVRLEITLSGDVAIALDEMAVSTDSTKTELIRRAIGLMKLAHEERKRGMHLGFASNPGKLDTEIVGNV